MNKLNQLADDDPRLDGSKLFHAWDQTIRYAEENNGIGIPQTKLFNRKFAHWGAGNFNWPDYSEEKRCWGVANESDFIREVYGIAKYQARFNTLSNVILLPTNEADAAGLDMGSQPPNADPHPANPIMSPLARGEPRQLQTLNRPHNEKEY